MSKRVLLLSVIAPVAAVIGGVLLLVHTTGMSWQSLLQPWGSWASAGVTFFALLTATGYYARTVVQNRATHEFDVLMRTVAVYHDLIPKKRAIVANYLLDRLKDDSKAPEPYEQLAMVDLMNYFDETCWRAFTVFKMDLGRCKVDVKCEHHWRALVQQRHEGVRVVLREIGYPASEYYRALKSVGQGRGTVVAEFPLDMHTQFKRMVDALRGYLEGLPLPADHLDRFLQREAVAPRLRASTTDPSAEAIKLLDERSALIIEGVRAALVAWGVDTLPGIVGSSVKGT